MRSNIVKIQFLSHQSLRSTRTKIPIKTPPPYEAQALPRAVIPIVETWNQSKNANPRSQTTHKERETGIYKVRQDAYVRRVEERNLLIICTRFTRKLQWFSQELTQQDDTQRFKSSIYRKKKPLQQQQVRSRTLLKSVCRLTGWSTTPSAVDRPVDRIDSPTLC